MVTADSTKGAQRIILGGMKGAKGHCWWHEGCSKVIANSTKGAQSNRWQHEGCSRSLLAAQVCPRSSLVAQGVPKVTSGGMRDA